MSYGSDVAVKVMWSHKCDPGPQNQSKVARSQEHIVWVKIIDFSFMPKIIRILSKDHVPWRYLVNFLQLIHQTLICD